MQFLICIRQLRKQLYKKPVLYIFLLYILLHFSLYVLPGFGKNDLQYNLGFEMINGERELYAYFGPKNNKAPFMSIASTGTRALFLYYIWNVYAFKGVSFLFIDEFDAFFHYESAEMIVKSLNYTRNFQSVLTSHNTYLMRNNLTRPDCCFIITDNKIKSLYNSTDREIREAHNLEKMYINGAFTE